MRGPRPGALRWWVAAAPTAAFLLGVLVLDVGHDAALVLTNLGQLSAAGWAARRARQAAAVSEGRNRRAWRCFGGAALVWATAQAVFGFHELVLRSHPPDAFELLYLAAVPLGIAGVLSFLETPAPGVARLLANLEGLALAASLLLVAWVAALRGAFEHADGDLTARVVAVTFPVVEVLVGALALFVAGRSRPGTRAQLALTGAGLGCFVVGDLTFVVRTIEGTYRTAAWPDAWWMAAWLLIGLASTRRAPEAGRLLGDGRLPLVTRLSVLLPVAAAVGTGLVALLGGVDTSTWVLLAVLLAALLAHTVVTAWERFRFTSYLEDEVARRTSELAASEAFVRAVLSHSSEVVIVVDEHDRVMHLTESLWGALGWDGRRFLGVPVTELVDTRDTRVLLAALARAHADPGRPASSTVRTRHADGSTRTLDLTLVSLLHDPALRATVINARDVTDRVALEQELAHLAFHDELTGLPNRTLLRDRIERALVAGRDVAVLFVDLDGFKGVNDALGHAAGDELLATVARRLGEVVGPDDTLARLGGDEFAVLVGEGVGRAVELAERVLAVLAAPHVIEGRALPIGASIGVASTATGSTSTELLRDADVAMYQAKSDGRGRIAVFTPAMHAAALAELELGAHLSNAMVRGELRLVYQPLVALDGGEVVGAEALLRWRHPTLGDVPPESFVPLAERSGAIVEIGRWVLATAASQALDWRRRYGPAAPRVSVNVSARQLRDAGFVDDAVRTVTGVGARPAWLTLELTESVLVDDLEDLVARLGALRVAGFGIAVDDFGTGYSTLSYLQRLPVDELKIDRSFVRGLERGGEEAGLVRMILELADTLGLTTVAEGIETEGQRRLLTDLGCRLGQGFLLALPGPPSAVDDLLGEVPAVAGP